MSNDNTLAAWELTPWVSFQCAGQSRFYRRLEGDRGKRMVRGAAVRDRGHLQDLCGEFRDADHLKCILEEAQTIVSDAGAAEP